MLQDYNKYNFLILEDNDGDYYLISDFLKEKLPKHTLTRYSNFKELENLQNANQYNAIFLDLNLPDLKGNDLVKKVCAMFYEVPVIVLTGSTFEEYGIDSLQLGASDYLIKENLNTDILYKSIIYSIERKANVLLLKKSRQLYHDLFEFNPQPTWIYDLETLKFLDVNVQAVKNYGFSKEEFLKMTIKDIRPKEEIPKLEISLQDFKSNIKPKTSKIFKHQKKDGTEFTVKIDSKIINYKNKNAGIIVATDISEIIKNHKIIEKQNEELREITWIQSHLVRSPVTKILSIVEIISWDTLNSSEREILFQGLKQSTVELDNVTRKIIDKSETILNPEKSIVE